MAAVIEAVFGNARARNVVYDKRIRGLKSQIWSHAFIWEAEVEVGKTHQNSRLLLFLVTNDKSIRSMSLHKLHHIFYDKRRERYPLQFAGRRYQYMLQTLRDKRSILVRIGSYRSDGILQDPEARRV